MAKVQGYTLQAIEARLSALETENALVRATLQAVLMNMLQNVPGRRHDLVELLKLRVLGVADRACAKTRVRDRDAFDERADIFFNDLEKSLGDARPDRLS